jgi:hypothetical protein
MPTARQTGWGWGNHKTKSSTSTSKYKSNWVAGSSLYIQCQRQRFHDGSGGEDSEHCQSGTCTVTMVITITGTAVRLAVCGGGGVVGREVDQQQSILVGRETDKLDWLQTNTLEEGQPSVATISVILVLKEQAGSNIPNGGGRRRRQNRSTRTTTATSGRKEADILAAITRHRQQSP